MGKVAMFFDYDGVLAPITVDPLNSGVRDELALTIKSLRGEFALAVVSGRDCPFLRRNAPGFDGYACVLGLEIHGGGYVVLDEEVYRGVKPRALEELSAKIKSLLDEEVGVIYGKTLSGVLIGISVYWYTSRGRPANLDEVIREALARGLVVYNIAEWGNFAEYVDIHVAKRNKQESTKILRALLGVDKVVYFGDSVNDVPAFREADIGVFVKHDFNRELNVDVDYVVEAERLPAWIRENLPLLRG